MKKVILLGLSLLVMMGCSSLKTSVDYDPNFKLTTLKTYAIVHYDAKGADTLFSDRVTRILEKTLALKGYVKVAKVEADFVVTFHANVRSQTDIDTNYTTMGYGRYGYGGGMMATTRSYTYKKGTLIIDALNPVDNKIVWRGIGTDVLKSYDTPEEKTTYLKSVVKEMLKDFPTQGSQH